MYVITVHRFGALRTSSRMVAAGALCGLLIVLHFAPASAQTTPIPLLTDLQPVTVLFPGEGNAPDLTADGRWLAYGVAVKAGPAERLVYVRDMLTGSTRSLTDSQSANGWATAPRWSPDGRWLAFFVRRNGKPTLALWDRLRDLTKVVLDAPTPGMPSVSWTENGESLLVVTEAPSARDERSEPGAADSAKADDKARPKVTVWRSAAAKRIEAKDQHTFTNPPTERSLLDDDLDETVANRRPAPTHDVWQVSVRSGEEPTARWVMRGAGINSMAVSPDGRWVAIFGNLRQHEDEVGETTGIVDLFLVTLGASAVQSPAGAREGIWTTARGERATPITTGAFQNQGHKGLSWSPDSRNVAYVNSASAGTGDIVAVTLDPKGGQPAIRNLTAGASLASPLRSRDELEVAEFRRFSYGNREPCAAPLWTADGRALVRAAGDDIWYIPLADGSVRNLTAKQPQLAFRAVLGVVGPSGFRQAAGEGDAVLVHALDKRTLHEGLWRIRLSDGELTPLLDRAARSLWIGSGFGDFSSDLSVVVTAVSSVNVPVELWTASRADMSDFQRITSWNRHDVDWMKRLQRRDLRWTTPAGRPARGVLLLPDQAQHAGRPPVIVQGYPGARAASRYSNWFGLNETLEAFALLSRGYAVFSIDVPIQPVGDHGAHGPLKEILSAVEAGVDALVATGLVDDERIVIHGHSYGGYMVNSVITHSNRFAAGIAGAGASNLTSAANTSIFRMRYYERGQGRLSATLWDEPQRYIANSPLFFLDRVKAPLLLYHGDNDPAVPVGQAEEMYRGLARLGQDVTLLRYLDKRHSLSAFDVRRDLWTRILDWLDARLKNPTFSSRND